MKICVEIPLSGRKMTKEELSEFATWLESAMDQHGAVSGEYAGRTLGNVRVYNDAADLMADRGE